MMKYDMMKPSEAQCLSAQELMEKYNDAVETIWFLQEKLHRLDEDYDDLMESFEELLDRLYG